MLPFKKILYPTDFSDPSYEALKAANELAFHFSAELCVVHVVSPVTTPPADPSGSNFLILGEMEKAARESLKEMVQKRIAKELLVRQILVVGGASEEIVQISEKERVDLIVIATHGQTGWRHFVFGSVAEKVVRACPMPRAHDPSSSWRGTLREGSIFFRRGGLWPTKYSIGGGKVMKKLAVNGLGRIGRLVLRHYLSDPPDNISIVAANDLTPADELAYLIRYDSVQRGATFPIEFGSNYLQLGSHRLSLFNEKDPANLPWKKLGVDIVLECTGLFRKRESAAKHLQAGAAKIIISAPADDADLTIVMGVNEKLYDPRKHQIISNASCTTNSLAPVAKVLNDLFGIEYLMATTIHAYTSSQSLVDRPTRKRRRGRAAAISLIPTSTGQRRLRLLSSPN